MNAWSPAVCAQEYNDCHIYVQFSSTNRPLSGTCNWSISGRHDEWNRFRIVRENQSFESMSTATMCRQTHKPMIVNYGHLLSPIIIISFARNKFSSNAPAHSCWHRYRHSTRNQIQNEFPTFSNCGIECFPVKKKRKEENTDSVHTPSICIWYGLPQYGGCRKPNGSGWASSIQKHQRESNLEKSKNDSFESFRFHIMCECGGASVCIRRRRRRRWQRPNCFSVLCGVALRVD